MRGHVREHTGEHEPAMRRFVAYGPAFVVLIVAVVVLLAAPALVRRVGYAETSYTVALASQSLEDDPILARINEAIRAIAVAVEPSVVHIEAQRVTGAFREGSTGSGWVYDLEGHIVTNAHVVGDADTYLVHFFDGRVVEAELVGRDIYTDIAVLRVNASEGLYPAHRSSTHEVHQGDRVFAFGSPFGFKFSMSEGIVSGLGRHPDTAVELGGYTNFIQTDAAVNPGNSGGPLINVHGEVIGMNVAIATGREADGTTSGQSSGISFAIPLATIESIVPQLIEKGRVSRGFLGIQYNRWEMAQIESGPYSVGVEVTGVMEGTPGERAGLLAGDIITEVNGQHVYATEILRSVIGTAAPGDILAMRVWREGQIHSMDVELTTFPPEDLAKQSLVQYGVELREAEDGGPPVFSVWRFSPAWRDDFRTGQRLIRVAGQDVGTPAEAVTRLIEFGLLRGKAVPVEIVIPGAEASTPVERNLRIAR